MYHCGFSDSDDESEEDKHSSLSSDDDDADENLTMSVTSNKKTAALSKKRVGNLAVKVPNAKRLRFSTNDEDEQQNEQQNLGIVINHLKQLDANILKIQKQQVQTVTTLERQNKLLKLVLTNQKKLAKAFTRHKVKRTLSGSLILF